MSLHCDLVVVTQDKPSTRRAWHSSRSQVPRYRIPLSQPTAALTARPEPVSRRSASQPSAVHTASKWGETTKNQMAAALFLSRITVFNPFHTLPRRKLALPRGRRLHIGLRDVGMARPSSSPRQPRAGSLPCFYDSREKFVNFGSAQPCRARLVRARACRCQNFDFEKILCRNVRHDLEAFRRFYASETPIFKNKP